MPRLCSHRKERKRRNEKECLAYYRLFLFPWPVEKKGGGGKTTLKNASGLPKRSYDRPSSPHRRREGKAKCCGGIPVPRITMYTSTIKKEGSQGGLLGWGEKGG